MEITAFESIEENNNDELVQVLAQELETLVVSCNNNNDDDDQVFDRDLNYHQVVVIQDVVYENEVKQAIDDEIQVTEAECLGENGAKNTQILGQNDNFNGNNNNNEEEEDLKDTYGWSDDGNDREYAVGDLTDYSGGWGSENRPGVWGEEGNGGLGNVNVPLDDYDDDGRLKSIRYPLRPDIEDCSYYIRTGMCKYGSNCKFNHPLKKKNQPTSHMERPGQIECKYFLSTGGCKYGKACKFNHGSRGKTDITQVLEYNFLGLPIRPGEKECPYYMRNGSCKYGSSCRFNHPDPTAVGGNDSHPPTTYGNDGRAPLQNTSQPIMTNMNNIPSWSASRTPDPPAAFVPMMYSQTQNIPPPNSDWNGYQAPVPVVAHVYPSSERGLPIPPAFFLNNPPSDTNMYTHHQQQQMLVSDYPERPGQPECSYFMKTGDCKYRSGCKFHHPKSRTASTYPSVLSDKGLPLRPDQNICSHYSRYGICKYGPACKYDHPVNYSNSGGEGGHLTDGRPLIQQSI